MEQQEQERRIKELRPRLVAERDRSINIPPLGMSIYYDRAVYELEPVLKLSIDASKLLHGKKPDFKKAAELISEIASMVEKSESLKSNSSIAKLLKDLQYNLGVVNGTKKGTGPYNYSGWATAGTDAL
ncbi:TPA: hypothetical protein HA225_00245, partial [Candidatus Micrarchaeota archaeon]|nr:hypothetical protein [Candidatus Micrarchaeota archaeon]